MKTGLEVLLQQRPARLKSARLGLLANQASLTGQFEYAWDALQHAYPGQLTVLLAPQHGLWSERQANMDQSPDEMLGTAATAVHSLYSQTRRPTAAMLRNVDVLLVDLQDVGTRVYTYAWTVRLCLAACAELQLPIVLLDRPNPLGRITEGPILEAPFRSFVGGAEIAMRHGQTLGELAAAINHTQQLGAELEVVALQDWDQRGWSEQQDRAWVPPSPNLPTLAAAQVYPGQVLLEGTNLSEGRGTTWPFQLFGAPFVRAERLLEQLAAFQLPGVHFRPVRFLPTFDKWAHTRCEGLALHVSDVQTYQPVRTTVATMACIRRLWPDQFRWLPPPYEYEQRRLPIDILAGSAAVREQIDRGSCRGPEDLDRLTRLEPDASRPTVEASPCGSGA